MKKIIISMLAITLFGLASCSSENRNNDGADTVDTSMNASPGLDTNGMGTDTTMVDTTTTDTTGTMPQ